MCTSGPITYNCIDYFHKINHSEYNDQSYVLVFLLFHWANGDLSMTSLRMTSHCMTSRCGVSSLLGLCEKDCSIHMLNFNKLRFIVYEILDNSQLFLTDPRNCKDTDITIVENSYSEIYMSNPKQCQI